MAVADRAKWLVQRYVEWIADELPVEATRLGDHSRDGQLPELTQTSLDRWIRWLSLRQRDVHEALATVPAVPSTDEVDAQGDLQQLADAIEARLFQLERRCRYHTDPLAVLSLVSDGVDELLRRARRAARDGGDPAVWIDDLASRLEQVPRLVEQGAALLRGAPEPHRTVALNRVGGLRTLLGQHVVDTVERLGQDVGRVAAAAPLAVEAITAYAAFLDELGDEPPLPWRLGPDQHATALRTALGSRMPADEVRGRAERALAERRTLLAERSGRLWTQLGLTGRPPADDDERIRMALEAVGRDASRRGQLVDDARGAVDEAIAWCRSSGVIAVPDTSHLTIAELPPHQQGLFVAYLEPAPTLEPDAGSTYHLSPVPDDWSDERASSFLREYNRSALKALAVHEAYPGHFVQLERASRHPRLARRLLGSSAFAEGWAVYAESMVQEVAQEHADDPLLGVYADARFQLVELKMQLRVAANALLDTGLHAGELDDGAALALLTDGAFQEPEEARGKLVRAKVTSGQLCSYFVGGEEMADLRAEVEARRGAAFTLRGFHEDVLGRGTPPVNVLRAELLAA